MKRKGFTLIELLAVIIILGILLLIAIPGVTGYINNSRKNIYVDTAKELIKGTSKLLNSGDFDTLDEDITYYMDSRCISNESGKEAQSPFGKFNPAYVLVVNENDEYNYYFQSRDETEVGVKDITKMDDLQISKIVSGVKEEDIDTSVGIGKTTKTAIIDENCNIGELQPASRRVSKDGEKMVTLTFDNQGGTGCEMQSQYYGEEWGKLCKPKKEGWKFVGWYTKENKLGDKITKTTKAEKSLTVYAAWTDQYATFDTGVKVNSRMKQLAGQAGANNGTSNANIIYIKWSEEEPIESNKQDINKVSASNSLLPIYAWFDTDTIYIWSIDEEPYLNSDSSYLFAYLKKVVSIDILDIINTSNTTSMSCMFFWSDSLKSLDLSNFDTSRVTTTFDMFWDCSSLTDIDVSSFDTSNVTNMNEMFNGCSKLERVDVSGFDTSHVTSIEKMFMYCYKLKEIDVSNWDTSNITNMKETFEECAVTTLDVSNWNTSQVTNMMYTFAYCVSLKNIDVSNFDTSNVTIMSYMFMCCSNLESIDVSNFNTSKVIHMSGLFHHCSKLESIDVNNFDTSNVVYLGANYYDARMGRLPGLFAGCKKLKSLDLSNWNTSKANGFGSLFEECESLTTVDISNFDTSNSLCFAFMFYECKNLVSVDLGNLDTSKATDIYRMFYNCSKLETIYIGNDFNITGISSYNELFYNCISLVGGAGTTWDSSMASDISYAIIDGKNGLPGLFSTL